MQPGRIADRVTNGSDVRRRKCTIDAIRNVAAAGSSGDLSVSRRIFQTYSLKQKGRHFCRPSLLETTQLDEVSISVRPERHNRRRNRRSGSLRAR